MLDIKNKLLNDNKYNIKLKYKYKYYNITI